MLEKSLVQLGYTIGLSAPLMVAVASRGSTAAGSGGWPRGLLERGGKGGEVGEAASGVFPPFTFLFFGAASLTLLASPLPLPLPLPVSLDFGAMAQFQSNRHRLAC